MPDKAFTKIDKNWNNDHTTRPHVKHQNECWFKFFGDVNPKLIYSVTQENRYSVKKNAFIKKIHNFYPIITKLC